MFSETHKTLIWDIQTNFRVNYQPSLTIFVNLPTWFSQFPYFWSSILYTKLLITCDEFGAGVKILITAILSVLWSYFEELLKFALKRTLSFELEKMLTPTMLAPLKLDRHLDVDARLKPSAKELSQKTLLISFSICFFLEKPDVLQSYTINIRNYLTSCD